MLQKSLVRNIRICGIILLIVALTTTAQAKFGRHSRIEIGYSYVIANGVYKGNAGIYDLNNGDVYLRDTAVNMKVKARYGLGFTAGVNFPLKRLSRRSTLALYWGLIYNEYLWWNLNPVFNVDGKLNENAAQDVFNNNLTGFTVKLGMPIGLDLKINTDAMCKRNPHIGATVGAGVIPQYNLTAMAYSGTNASNADISAGLNYGLTPYVKGEISFYLGICMKLKAIYTFGNLPLIDHTRNILATDGPFTMTETSCLTISYTVLPFSFLWRKRNWYNEFETGYEYYKTTDK